MAFGRRLDNSRLELTAPLRVAAAQPQGRYMALNLADKTFADDKEV